MEITDELQAIMDCHSWKSIDDIDWYHISLHEPLSDNFIIFYEKKIYWSALCKCRNLSEKFIEKHWDKLNQFYVSIYQKLSEKFILKHKEELDADNILKNQKLSRTFIKENFVVDWI